MTSGMAFFFAHRHCYATVAMPCFSPMVQWVGRWAGLLYQTFLFFIGHHLYIKQCIGTWLQDKHIQNQDNNCCSYAPCSLDVCSL